MRSVRTSNKNARSKVQDLQVFRGSNTFAEYYAPSGDTLTHRYVVYSYGYHFPMFIAEWLSGYDPQWYENMDRYSRSTSKHKSQLHPLTRTTQFDTEQMKHIARVGMAGLVVYGKPNPYIFDPKTDRVAHYEPRSLQAMKG